MKSILIVAKHPDIDIASVQALSNFAEQIEAECLRSNLQVTRLNVGAYTIPWSNAMRTLTIFLSAASQRNIHLECLVFDDSELLS
jgi:hypothetical protein